MAAFPPPTLALYVPPPLRDLFRNCEHLCTAACCGTRAFNISPTLVRDWLAGVRGPASGVCAQFETLLDQIGRHRGAVQADHLEGCFGTSWPTPHDCLTYFAEWRRAFAEALRTMYGSPFFSPSWLTEPVVALRDAILADRAFDRLPILADALEESGCDNREILDHLRAGDDHSHMCWVLDVLSEGDGRPVR